MAAGRQLKPTLDRLKRTSRQALRLATDAQAWCNRAGGGLTETVSRRDLLVELAYFQCYIAWEAFLESAFLLYLLGRTAPRGGPVHRYATPPTWDAAKEFVVPEGRSFASWAAADVVGRSERFFRGGGPFLGPLSSRRALFEDARVLRNAVAHDSGSARKKFETLVRKKIGTLPAGLTVGAFLLTTDPAASPPSRFLYGYVEAMETAASQIVPC